MKAFFVSLGRTLWLLTKVLIFLTVLRVVSFQLGYRDHIPGLDTVLLALFQGIQDLAMWASRTINSLPLFFRYITGR